MMLPLWRHCWSYWELTRDKVVSRTACL